MKWIVHPKVREQGIDGVEWLKEHLSAHDTKKVDWVRVDLGRDNYGGAYGRCWYPEGRKKGFRISLQVPGPFPFDIRTRRRPIYVTTENGVNVFSRDLEENEVMGEHVMKHQIVKGQSIYTNWIRVCAKTRVNTMDEAIVWVGAHEVYHFLTKSKQLKVRNGEIEADAYADKMLFQYREQLVKEVKKIA
jgi:hypothetical protein